MARKLDRTLARADVQMVRDIANETVSWQWSTERGDPALVHNAVKTLLVEEAVATERPPWASRIGLAGAWNLPVSWVPSPLELHTGIVNPGNLYAQGPIEDFPKKLETFMPGRIVHRAARYEFSNIVSNLIAREMILPNNVLVQTLPEIRTHFSALQGLYNSGSAPASGHLNGVDHTKEFRDFSYQWANYLYHGRYFNDVTLWSSATAVLYDPQVLALARVAVQMSTIDDDWFVSLTNYVKAWETVFRYTSGICTFVETSTGPAGHIYLAQRPVEVHASQQRLHTSEGKAIRWEDNFGFDSWRGVTVPAWNYSGAGWRVMQARSAMPTRNRQAMLDRIGWGDILDNGLIKEGVLHSATAADPANPGFLKTYVVRGAAWNDPWSESMAFLVGTNGTPEPDGSRRKYGLRIPWDLRLDPIAAAAWGYGVTKKQYEQLARRT